MKHNRTSLADTRQHSFSTNIHGYVYLQQHTKHSFHTVTVWQSQHVTDY